MAISPYLRGLRQKIGHEFVLLASVAVLPWDERGRLLLVRAADSGLWQTIGGAVEPDESPHAAATREADEEAGVVVALERIRCVTGGAQFRLLYPNGDLVGYVPTVFDARVLDGTPRADGEETLEVAWFSPAQLAPAQLTEFTHALFEAAGVDVGA